MDYYENQPLLYKTINPQGFTEIKQVVFIRTNEEDSTTADVMFGFEADKRRNIFRVPLSALSIETARPIPPAYVIPPPPAPPPRISIETRRDMLRLCHQDANKTAEALAKAAEVLGRAKVEVAAAEVESARIARVEQRQAKEYADALRTGNPTINGAGTDYAAKSQIASRISRAEAALGTFQREFDIAETNHSAAKANVTRAASDVVAAVIEAQSDDLREFEGVASKLRSNLRAALEFWPTGTSPVAVNAAVAGFIIQEPNHSIPQVAGYNGRQAAVEHRQRPFRDLYNRLLLDPDAQYEP